MRKMSPSKQVRVFSTSLQPILYGVTEMGLENAKGEANIIWHKHGKNYKWVRDNAIKDSVKFHAHFDIMTLEYRVAVTAEFEPEDLVLYYLQFGD